MTKKRGKSGKRSSTGHLSSTCKKQEDRVGPVGRRRYNKSGPFLPHTDHFWNRLRKQLQVCDYPGARTYNTIGECQRAHGVQLFREQIEEVEQRLMARKDEPTREHKEHWDRVASLGCIVTGQPATIAHCHGGSISTELGPKFRPGIAQRQNHWLVLPLADWLHQGPQGLDTGPAGVKDWEDRWGLQIHLLEEVSLRLGYCVFEKAGVDGYEYQAVDPPSQTA